jgi:hypothetical protein
MCRIRVNCQVQAKMAVRLTCVQIKMIVCMNRLIKKYRFEHQTIGFF